MNPLENTDWDEGLASFEDATFFHTSAWARVLHSTYGFRPTYFTTTTEHDISSVLPMMEIDSWLTGRRGVSLPFTDLCPVLTKPGTDTAELWADVVQVARQRKWKYVECRGSNQLTETASSSLQFFGHHLDLRRGVAGLFESCHESVRRAVRKSAQSEVKIEFSRSADGIQSFYELVCRTRKRHGLPIQPREFFHNIFRYIISEDKGEIVLAKLGSRTIAGGMFFRYRNTALYKFGASDESFQQVRANNLVMWSAIKNFSERGFHLLDFGRTSMANQGLRRFKLSWGAAESTLNYFKFIPRTHRFIQSGDDSSGWHNSIFRALPIPFLRVAGAVLYKHLA